ncbi:MAG: RnfABCDGE type electron transport complex subunit B [Candidatus Latescibacteria bacterium]|jgi:Na+-translocating ferredoxin:NAD+ oxidoreductase subunit B|nr:RnfABCDGE type electron transport complex subunit B [Candidatus Latescibacterota bacterium]
MNPVFLYTLVSLGSISFILGAGLAFASRRFAVEIDPRVEQLIEILPGANCGGCGYAGCAAYAGAIIGEDASVTLCAPGGNQVIQEISELLGLEEVKTVRQIAYLHCAGSKDKAKDKYIYDGIEDCRVAVLLAGGPKACNSGCLGFGSCVGVCKFDALTMGEDGLPVVDREKCTACGACVRTCPKHLFTLLQDTVSIYLACSSHEKGKAVKEACSVGCIGCSICVKVTESDEIEMKDSLPSINYNASMNLVLAHYKCPTNSYIDLAPKRPYMVIDKNNCKGHGKCGEVCPVKNCVTGEQGEIHSIDPKACIGCGLCLEVCPPKAIRVIGAMGYVNMDQSD